MTAKHNVDPSTQASMLPPENEQLEAGRVVEIEGGYYRADPANQNQSSDDQSETDIQKPEQARIIQLRDEDMALDFLGRAEKTKNRISSMSRGRIALSLSGEDQAEQARLMETTERSEQTALHFGRVAKRYFARSLGIETEERTLVKFIESRGINKEVREVIAKDPDEQEKLSREYRVFLDAYQRNGGRRQKRRAEIAKELEGLETSVE